MWTADALRSELKDFAGDVWRMVERQSRTATLRLTDSAEAQQVLEDILEATKPPLPVACADLHYLLYSPFRYAPYPHGSRFRQTGSGEGVFYAGLDEETAAAEVAFHVFQFFSEAPTMKRPARGVEKTSFRARVSTERALDLTAPPLDRDRSEWTDPVDYGPCQTLAEAARGAGAEALLYQSVRDPRHRRAVAILAGRAFATRAPVRGSLRTWRFLALASTVRAVRDLPPLALDFDARPW